MKKGIRDSRYFVLVLSRNTWKLNKSGRSWVMEEVDYARSINKPIRLLMRTDPRFGGVTTFEEMKDLTPENYRWVFETDEEVIPFHMKCQFREASIRTLLDLCPDLNKT